MSSASACAPSSAVARKLSGAPREVDRRLPDRPEILDRDADQAHLRRLPLRRSVKVEQRPLRGESLRRIVLRNALQASDGRAQHVGQITTMLVYRGDLELEAI